MGIGVSIVTHTRYLPRHFYSRLAAFNIEAVVRRFFRDVKIRSRCADRRQLIAKVAIERLELFRQLHPRLPPGIQLHDAVADVHHVPACDERVRQGLVGRIQRIAVKRLFFKT